MKPHALILVALLALSASSRAQAPLKLEQTIPLPGLKEGDFDHFAVDLAGQLLFLTAEKNAAVEVFDFQTNKLVHTITGLDERLLFTSPQLNTYMWSTAAKALISHTP